MAQKKPSVYEYLEGQKEENASVGDVIVVAIKMALPESTVKKGSVQRAVIVRVSKEYRRKDGTYIRFDDNACVILDGTLNPRGKRVFGPVARELREVGQMKIISLAPEVL